MNKLFEPGRIGKLEIKNRLVMAAMGTHSCDAEGFVTNRALQYYAARARGGVGLIIVQSTAVTRGDSTPNGMKLYDDRFIPGLRQLARTIHEAGAKTLLQLNHHGKMFAKLRLAGPHPEEIEVFGPSAVPSITDPFVPNEMSPAQIRTMVNAFAEASRRAREAGFDGVEIHAAHAYLLHSFLSPITNKRDDEYGGDASNRARAVCEVLRATRAKVGPDFPIALRVSGMEPLDGGITIEDVLQQAPLFVEAGADAIHVSAGATDYPVLTEASYLDPDGALVHLAEAVKKAVNVPVITVGKIGDPVLAERILQEGRADFVAMGRPLLADSELPNKAREGRLEDINRCLFCNNCFRMLFAGGKMSDFTCTVNPDLLGECDSKPELTRSPKKVMVIGGGLAGMLASRNLAQRGHQVSLYEKNDRLGGQWNIVCMEEGKAGFARFSEYLQRGMKKAGVKVFLSQEATLAVVEDVRPEAVVLATGASPATLDVSGARGKNVVQAVDVISGKASVGDSVVVLGGRYLGMEIALSLARQGKRVTLATRRELGKGVELSIYLRLRNELIGRGVQVFTKCPVSAITPNGVYVTHQERALFLKAATVVLAVGSTAENGLAERLKAIVPEIHIIGDCLKPRTAIHATQEASRISRLI